MTSSRGNIIDGAGYAAALRERLKSHVADLKAAHGLTPNIPAEMKVDYVQPNVGHYGVFNGRRFREEIYPKIRDFTHRWDVREAPREEKPKLSVVGG